MGSALLGGLHCSAVSLVLTLLQGNGLRPDARPVTGTWRCRAFADDPSATQHFVALQAHCSQWMFMDYAKGGRREPHLAHEVDDANDELGGIAVDAHEQGVVHHAQRRQERRVRPQRLLQPATSRIRNQSPELWLGILEKRSLPLILQALQGGLRRRAAHGKQASSSNSALYSTALSSPH